MSSGVPEITGSSSSVIVTVKLSVVTLPSPSVDVYVTVVTPTEKVAPEACVCVNVVEQLSVLVASVHVTTASHWPASVDWEMFAGVPEITGNSLSSTVTTCVSVAVLFDESVTVHVTVVFPSGTEAGASFVTVYVQLSAAVAEPKLTPEANTAQLASSVLNVTSAGAVMVGFVVS